MFGAYYFGWPYWADSPNVAIAPPPTPVPPTFTYETLVVVCRTRICADLTGRTIQNDFSLSRLQEISAGVDPVPIVECRKRTCSDLTGITVFDDFSISRLQEPAAAPAAQPIVECKTRICSDITGIAAQGDLQIYNLQDAIYFNGTPLSFIVECPPGYYCPPGTFPKTFTYPTGEFTFPKPNDPGPGNPIVFSMEGCSSVVTIVLPSGSSQAAQDTAAQQVIDQVAQQQAQCDAINSLPPGSKIPTVISLSDIGLYACVDVPFSATINASATPSGAPYTIFTVFPPAWMADNQSGSSLVLSGTPTAIGQVTFDVTATGTNSYGSKNYLINIVGIDNASPLPNANDVDPYSEVLTATTIPGILIWSVVAGSLPTWASLNSMTGEIFGNPPTASVGDIDNFTIQVTNGTITCTKEFDIETESGHTPCGDYYLALTWFPISYGGTGTRFATAGAGVVTFTAQANAGQTANIFITSSFEPPLAATLNCHVTSTITTLAASVSILRIQVVRASDAVRVLDITRSFALGDSPGVYVDAFTMGIGQQFNVFITAFAGDTISAGSLAGTLVFGP